MFECRSYWDTFQANLCFYSVAGNWKLIVLNISCIHRYLSAHFPAKVAMMMMQRNKDYYRLIIIIFIYLNVNCSSCLWILSELQIMLHHIYMSFTMNTGIRVIF